jgi:hypothetical protein
MDTKHPYVALLMPLGAKASIADLNQRKLQPVCKLLEVHPVNNHLIAPDGALPLLDTADESGCYE